MSMKNDIILQMATKKLTLVLIIILVGALIFVTVSNKSENVQIISTCSEVSLETSKLKSEEIRKRSGQYTQEKSEIFGLSTEGGEQTKYTDDIGDIKIVEQIFLGESGRSKIEYYYYNDKIFLISKSNFEYVKPIFVDPSGDISKIDIGYYTLNNNYKVCGWYLNGELQDNSSDTQESVNFFINSLE